LAENLDISFGQNLIVKAETTIKIDIHIAVNHRKFCYSLFDFSVSMHHHIWVLLGPA